jgi:hypothetical protein
MLKTFSLAMLAGLIAAAGQSMTTNECLENEGAFVEEECFGMYMNLCHSISIEADNNCNIRIFDNAQLNWLANEVKAQSWTYLLIDMSPEAAATELGRQADEEAAMAARRERDGTAKECVCGEYDCEYYDCQDYDQEGNLKGEGELESFLKVINY